MFPLLVIDFMNIKIKPTQSFRCAYRSRMCICVHKDGMSAPIYVYIVDSKKILES
jgi:hypothetical protein